MKIKFKSALHRKTFTEFITANVKNPYLSRNEYIAAVFLLSADKFLWKRARRALTGYSVNFSSLNLSGISTEGYALFMTAKAIYRGGVDISLHELCDADLIDDSTVMTIFAGVYTLSELGYCVEWMVHNSARFGVPQSRRRTYIVGHRRSERAGKIFPVECGDCESPVEIIDGPQGSRVYSAEGTSITQCAGGSGGGGKTGIYFFDMNPNFDFTENARCLLARYDSGVSNHKGVNSGIFIEGDFPNAVRFIDKNGVLRIGILRKLMPIESWRLQGFDDAQFNKAAALGLSDGQLYKMAGNAVSVPVIKAIGEKIRDVIFDGGSDVIAKSYYEPLALGGGSEQN